MDSMDLLTGATGRGRKSSEFFLAIVGIILVVAVPLTLGQAIAVGVIVGAYAVARAVVKSATSRALLTEVTPPVRLTENREIRLRD